MSLFSHSFVYKTRMECVIGYREKKIVLFLVTTAYAAAF